MLSKRLSPARIYITYHNFSVILENSNGYITVCYLTFCAFTTASTVSKKGATFSPSFNNLYKIYTDLQSMLTSILNKCKLKIPDID